MALEFWQFLRKLCRFAKVERGKEHRHWMHQCTTEVLCNLAGLIFGLACHASLFVWKPIRLAFKAKQVFYIYHFEKYFFCVFEYELILVWDIFFIWTSTVKTGTVPPQQGTNIFIHDSNCQLLNQGLHCSDSKVLCGLTCGHKCKRLKSNRFNE